MVTGVPFPQPGAGAEAGARLQWVGRAVARRRHSLWAGPRGSGVAEVPRPFRTASEDDCGCGRRAGPNGRCGAKWTGRGLSLARPQPPIPIIPSPLRPCPMGPGIGTPAQPPETLPSSGSPPHPILVICGRPHGPCLQGWGGLSVGAPERMICPRHLLLPGWGGRLGSALSLSFTHQPPAGGCTDLSGISCWTFPGLRHGQVCSEGVQTRSSAQSWEPLQSRDIFWGAQGKAWGGIAQDSPSSALPTVSGSS